MQQIERYGVIALVFLLVTIVAVSFWGDSKSPGFWARLTGRGVKKDDTTQTTNMIPPASSTERAIDPALPLTATDPTATTGVAPAPQMATGVTQDPWMNAPTAPPEIAGPGYPVQGPQPTTVPVYASPAPEVAPVRSTPPPAATGVQYTVQKGDSLIRIAARTLGSGSRWTEIQSLNGNLDPRGLRPGMKLVLPASARIPSGAASPAKSTGKSPAAKPAATAATGTYVVRAGDTLSGIASRLLGDGDRWREIVAANPGLDPKRLLVGKSISVPRGGEPARATPARSTPSKTPVLAAAEPRSDRPRVR